MFHNRLATMKKPILSAILVSFVFSAVFGLAAMLGAQPAYAQFDNTTAPAVAAAAGAQGALTGAGNASTGLNTATTTANKVWDALKVVLANVAALVLLNVGNYFLQKIAYDAANYIASAGSGQKPLFTTQSFGDYMADIGKGAAGEALGTISQEGGFEKLGIDLCSPAVPQVSLNIKMGYLKGLPNQLGGPAGASQPRPKCDWNQISSNWQNFSQQASNQVLNNVGTMFKQGQSDLSSAIGFNQFSAESITKQQNQQGQKYVANNGMKDVTSKVTGQTLTPAEAVKAQMAIEQKKAGDQQGKDVAISGDAFKQGAYAVLQSALKTFASTLLEKLMKRLFEKGMVPIDTSAKIDLFAKEAAGPVGGKNAAQLSNADLLTPKVFTSSNYDPLLDFAACPQGFKDINNCVLDSQFFSVITRSQSGSQMTLAQAIDQGFIQGGWRLIPLSHPKNRDQSCYLDAFCYSNLVKLRLARIIPIGWELAANSPFNDPASPVTLKETMDRFDDCPRKGDGTLNTSKLPDPQHPWCHLVDPNWVLKYPKTICRLQAPGPLLLNPQSAGRSSVCVDPVTCISQDAEGNCTGGYGYCSREKNIWQFDADACPAEFASCQAVKTADGKAFAYLMNTVKVGVCNADNTGCRQYSQIKNAITNGGFEDVLSGAARGWTGGVRLDITGSKSFQGMNALGVSNANQASSAAAAPILPNTEYALAASALADAPVGPNETASVTVKFLDRLDKAAGGAVVNAPCTTDGGKTNAAFAIPLSSLGYQSGGCKITSPPDAVKAFVTLSSSVATTTWFDEVGMYGNSYSAAPLDNIFLNGKAESCAANAVGCQDFIRASSASLNLVRNPGFEDKTADGTLPKYWTMMAADYQSDLNKGFEGTSSVRLSDVQGHEVEQKVYGVQPNASYVFSVYSKHDGANAAPAGQVLLTVYKSNGQQGDQLVCGQNANPLPLAVGKNYVRSTCQFNTPADVGFILISMKKTSGTDDLLADAVQLELGVQATEYHAEYSTTAEHVTMKAAPEGMSCTGSPNDPAECANFAASCRRDEVGCNLYKPDNGTSVPAVITTSDLCPAECNGYETFRQEPTNYAASTFPVFFIPSTAKACSASEAGCEEFTNLSKLAIGGEAREYYTYLRYCQKPDPNTATYYTWEGNEAQGYQLRVWTLRKSNITSAAADADPTGGIAPCTTLRYNPDGTPVCQDALGPGGAARCSKAVSAFDPDCREFYDVDGNTHYRYYSKTVVSTDNCTDFRMTSTSKDDCNNHGGLWQNNECHYFGYKSESSACSAAAAGCKAYTGNVSRNVRNVLSDNFSDNAADGWMPNGGVAASIESVTVGGHSLKVTVAKASKPVGSLVSQGHSYLISFWAKGSGDVRASFSPNNTAPFGTVALTTDWKPYTLGPVPLGTSLAPTDTLDFNTAADANHPVFLANILLQEIAQSVYAIRDSWKTPAVCDQTPSGDPAPQYMLGCKNYSDRNKKTVYLKSFDRLCREQAVGCDAFYDTKNTPSPFPQSFNAVCTLNAKCVPQNNALTCSCQVGGQTVCQVTIGDNSCKYNSEAVDTGTALAPSGDVSPDGDTARVPADSLRFLIENKRFQCKADAIGCREMGDRTLNPDGDVITAWTPVYLKNQPESYAKTLCTKAEEYCQTYTRVEDGGPLFFKDPGTHTCEFKTSVNVGGFNSNGWFKTGTTEPCYPDFLQAGNLYGIWKNKDIDKYGGWAGMCPASASRCKEFIDPLDKSSYYPAGQPYYAIKNERLDTKTCANQVSKVKSPSAAKEAASCILFDQSDNVTLTANTAATYAASDAQFGALVDPVSLSECSVSHKTCTSSADCDQNNKNDLCLSKDDTNVILRVKRDRQCAEWLDCRTSENVFNPAKNAFQNVCTAFGLCDQFQKVGDSTRCVHFIPNENSGLVLNDKVYEQRKTGWDGLEYSGYSVPNRYPVEELTTVNLAKTNSCASSSDCDGNPCTSGQCIYPPDRRLVYTTKSCTSDTDCSPNNLKNSGKCFNRQCVWPIDGSAGVAVQDQLRQTQALLNYPTASCRAYPQEDAPFPSSIADPSGWDNTAAEINNGNPVLISPSPAFSAANICQRRLDRNGVEVGGCECSYLLATYGGAVAKRYLSTSDSNIPAGYCDAGDYGGYECDPLANKDALRTKTNLSCCSKLAPQPPTAGGEPAGEPTCGSGSECKSLSKLDYLVGYEGQCLERDFTTPINNRSDEFACATWRPVGLIGGSRDIYNLYKSAGYFTPINRKYFCTDSYPEWSFSLSIQVCSISKTACMTDADCGKNDGVCIPQIGQGAPALKPSVSSSTDEGNLGSSFNAGDIDNVPESRQASLGFFGPGTVNNGVDTSADDQTVNKVEIGKCDSNNNEGKWCTWPGFGQKTKTADSIYTITTKPAIGPLGCYKVAGGSSGNLDTTFIDYPYIGPAVYRDQLKSIKFTLEGGLTPPEAAITNPGRDVSRVCEQAGSDSADTEIPLNLMANSIMNLPGDTFNSAKSCFNDINSTLVQAVNTAQAALNAAVDKAINSGVCKGVTETTDTDPNEKTDTHNGVPDTPMQEQEEACLQQFGAGSKNPDATIVGDQNTLNTNLKNLQNACSPPDISKYDPYADCHGDAYDKMGACSCTIDSTAAKVATAAYIFFTGGACASIIPAPGIIPCVVPALCYEPSHQQVELRGDNDFKNEFPGSHGAIRLTAIFNKTTYRLESIRVAAKDTSNNRGTFAITAVNFNFMAGCKNVQRVDQPGELGLTKAYTDDVNNWRQFSQLDTDKNPNPVIPSTRFAQACVPWGGIGAQSQEPLNSAGDMNQPWTLVVPYRLGGQPVDKPPNNSKDREIQAAQCTINNFRTGSQYASKDPDAPNVPKAPNAPLTRLFRQIFGKWSYQLFTSDNPQKAQYKLETLDPTIDDRTGDTTYRPEFIQPPRIASVDVHQCGADGHCPLKNVDAMTVSGKDAGALIGNDGIFQASLQFYAWAGDNQMPILSRTIVWGDAAPKEPPAKGWYKNRKPYCSADTSESGAVRECDGYPGVTCTNDADCPGTEQGSCHLRSPANHFGNTPGACDTNPFKFDHTYTCTLQDLNALGGTACQRDKVGKVTNAPCVEKNQNSTWQCVYKPKVQIVDNWGWCNCTGTECKSKVARGNYDVTADPNTGGCKIDGDTTGRDAKPWTEFRGEIDVIASQ